MKQRPRVQYTDDNFGFGYQGKYSDDSGDELVLLSTKSTRKQEQFVEADILDGDTLQAIALRFNCSVASLKKANNIHKENEIHARRKLKIPVKAFSLLTENFPLVHTSGSNSPTKVKEVIVQNTEPLSENLQEKLLVASVNSSEVRNSMTVSNQGPQSYDIPSTSSQFLNSEISDNVIASETVPLIMENAHHNNSVEDIVLKEFTSKGDDFGLKWFHLLLFMLMLCVVVPLIYVYYIAEHPEIYHHHT